MMGITTCQRPDCKFNHDLVDNARIEKLAWWEESADNDDALTVECRVEGEGGCW